MLISRLRCFGTSYHRICKQVIISRRRGFSCFQSEARSVATECSYGLTGPSSYAFEMPRIKRTARDKTGPNEDLNPKWTRICDLTLFSTLLYFSLCVRVGTDKTSCTCLTGRGHAIDSMTCVCPTEYFEVLVICITIT
ncbi:hypothetical protein BU24DRAFT_134908 [Aaosphaeria arxii CBS 175.79]|uniref:Uncharacterized protein n=1 Tax=Aaosphaeria arxii CBS 175.79 TaxID=1450172 RepID=A0A6A5Y4J7_9PLEO|nr:uncharacterized protein BU24DRAFT_134908 [Aaosphaeria arxii CBS 175.79]KAF2020176.1 hypothetical protein BU24DRAFT_134908 [Aaosphaeria arxii CBS 175.79]